MPLTAILLLGATPEQLGILAAAQFAPVLVITLFAGVWLDSHRRRPALIVANVGRAVLLGLVPLLSTWGVLNIVDLYAIGFLAGLLTALFDIAYIVYLPAIVEPIQLVDANAKLQATYSTSQIAGPGLGGVLVQLVTAPIAILADAVSYVLAAGCVAWIRRPEAAPEARPRVSTLSEIRRGLGITLRDPLLRPLVAQAAWFNLFERVVLTLYLLYGVRNLHLSASLLGAALAVGSVGSLAGTFIAGWVGRKFGTGRTLVGSMMIGSAALAAIPAASGSAVAAVSVLVLGFAIYGVGLTVYNVYALSLRQAIVPSRLLGRVTATYRFLSFGTIPLGAILGGILGEALGVRDAMAIAVAALLFGTVAFAFTPIRNIGDFRKLVPREPVNQAVESMAANIVPSDPDPPNE